MRTGERIRRYFFIFMFYLIGIAVIILFSESRLNETAKNKANWITSQLNSAISKIEDSYINNLQKKLPVTNCNRFLNDSQPILLSSPYIRSVSASNGGVIVCSSITRSIMTQIINWQPPQKSIALHYVVKTPFADLFPPDSQSVLTLRFAKDEYYGLYVAIYPEMIFKMFGVNRYYLSSIHFENATFNSDGSIKNEINRLASGKLFQTSYTLSMRSILTYAFHNYGLVMLAWTIMILLGARTFISYMDTFSLNYWRVRRAISRKQFVPYVQPVFDAYGNVTGGEVLVRWLHPRKGVIPPSAFIEFVEENGQIIPISTLLIMKCAEAFKAVDMAPRERYFRLGFNVTPLQLDSQQLMNDIAKFQIDLRHQPIDMLVELTERNEFESNEHYKAAIATLRNRNVLIALDDFGTGNCSLKYLHNAQIDMIKIDRMYVATIDGGEHTKLLENIISLARSLNVPLLAEGVETQAQFEYLKKFNIERYQGFLFGHPIPLDEFIKKYIPSL